MKFILTNYEADCTWVTDYTEDYLIYDRSECGLPLRIPRPNIGDADYDRLCYLVDHYDTLPDLFLLAKSNLIKYISKEEFDALPKDGFTPLLTQHHKVYDPVCFYKDGWYWERNDSWYLGEVRPLYFSSFAEWAKHFGLPNPSYIPFAPGGNYLLTRETVHRYPKAFYEEMRATLPWSVRPGEAQLAERSYGLMWGSVH